MSKYPIELKDIEFNLDDIKAEIVDAINDAYQQGRKDTIDELNGIIAESVRMMWHDTTTMPKIKEWLDKQIKEQTNDR